MALKFFNIRSRETVVAETEPMVAALWGSSDRGPNATVGQDFGWRLAPEVVVELRKIEGDYEMKLNIAKRYNMLPEDITETDVLQYISERYSADNSPSVSEGDYREEYEEEIRRLQNENKPKRAEEVLKTDKK